MCNNKINYVECPEAIHMYIVSCQGLGVLAVQCKQGCH